jgi:hypothetical protein
VPAGAHDTLAELAVRNGQLASVETDRDPQMVGASQRELDLRCVRLALADGREDLSDVRL